MSSAGAESIKVTEDTEAARTSAERQRLDEIAAAQDDREKALVRERATLRRGKRALAAAMALLVCVIAGAVGWYNQNFLKQQYYWRAVMHPFVLTGEQEREKARKRGSDFKECANGCPTMIVVPAGKFTMGSPETENAWSKFEGPQHEVTIAKPFAVGKTDVTFAEWDICVAAGACPRVTDGGWGRGDRPVVQVSWDDAKGYVTWLKQITGKDYRLLSEAEWEYSARAGTQGRWSFGDDEGQLGDHAWFEKNSEYKTQPAAKKKPNAFGLYDMHGNVWQWVEDPYHGTYNGAPTDGSVWNQGGTASSRVQRGGSWANDPQFLRSAFRVGNFTVNRADNVGFRVARTLTP